MNQNKEDFKPGTLVFLSQFDDTAGFGVVFEEKFWEQCAQAEDPVMLMNSTKYIAERIPVRLFGTVIGRRWGYDVDEPDPHQVVHYTWSNPGGNISIIKDQETLMQYLHMMKRFNFSEYFDRVIFDLIQYGVYFKGVYDLTSNNLSPYSKKLIRLFEKGIPKQKVPL